MQRDMDTLTPLDARNSLLLDRKQTPMSETNDFFSIAKTGAMQEVKAVDRDSDPERYAGFATTRTSEPISNHAARNLSVSSGPYRPLTPSTPLATDNLVANAAPIGRSDMGARQPTLPNMSMNMPGAFPSAGPTYNGPTQSRFGNGGGYGQQGGGGYGQSAGPGYNGYGGAYRAPSRGGY